MTTITRMLLTAALLPGLLLATGCSRKTNPMAPELPEPSATEYIDVTVTLVRLFAVADGDGIEGAGEFEYEAVVNDGPGPLVVSGYQVMNTGETHAINQSKVMRIEKGASYNIEVKFTATEWDVNILGTVYPDTRMDNLSERRVHSTHSGTAGFNDGERWITLGEGDLQFRLIYTITSKPVV